MHRLSILCLSAILLLPASAWAKLRVVTTLPDFASMAKELGGDRVEADSLIRGTQNPHDVDAKPSFIVKVSRADLLIVIGLDLEAGWLPALLGQARNAAVRPGGEGYLDASRLAHLREVPTVLDRSMGDIHAGGNPHYYTSPEEIFRVAGAIRDKLVALDPKGKGEYLRRFDAFEAKYKEKMAGWRKRLAPLAGTEVVVYHTSWIYFLKWAGLVRIGALEPKPGIPPSAGQVTRLLMMTRSRKVRFVIQEIYQPTRLSRVFARKAGARLLILPSMVGAAEGTATIWDKFDRIVDQLTSDQSRGSP